MHYNYTTGHNQIFRYIDEQPTEEHGYKHGYKHGYHKAIDDFSDRLSEYLNVKNATKYGNKNSEQQRNSYETLMKYEIADAIEDVAEQLKVGGRE